MRTAGVAGPTCFRPGWTPGARIGARFSEEEERSLALDEEEDEDDEELEEDDLEITLYKNNFSLFLMIDFNTHF